MKILILTFSFLYFTSAFCQTKPSDYMNFGNSGSTSKIVVTKAAEKFPPSLEVVVPVQVDLNKYTHIALVDATYNGQQGKKRMYKNLKPILSASPFQIIDPFEYNKRLAKIEPTFLRHEKNPTWLYVYYYYDFDKVNKAHTFVVRDFENNIIYHCKGLNVPKQDLASPVVFF